MLILGNEQKKGMEGMKERSEFPTREDLNEAFHLLQDQITRITVEEEEEMVSKDLNGKKESD